MDNQDSVEFKSQLKGLLLFFAHNGRNNEEWEEYTECMDEEEIKELNIDMVESLNNMCDEIVGHENVEDVLERVTDRLCKYAKSESQEKLSTKLNEYITKLKENRESEENAFKSLTGYDPFGMTKRDLEREEEYKRQDEEREAKLKKIDEEKKAKEKQYNYELSEERTLEETIGYYNNMTEILKKSNELSMLDKIKATSHWKSLDLKLVKLKDSELISKVRSDARQSLLSFQTKKDDNANTLQENINKRNEEHKKRREEEINRLKAELERTKNFEKELLVLKDEGNIDSVISKINECISEYRKSVKCDDNIDNKDFILSKHIFNLINLGENLVSNINDKEKRKEYKLKLKEYSKHITSMI